MPSILHGDLEKRSLINDGNMSKSVVITQSNYIPWKGYFDSIAAVDLFVVYDDMQYTKRDWRNRNLIPTPNGLKWLSIAVDVKGKYHQKINETLVSDHKWIDSHLGQLHATYGKSPCFKQVWPLVEGWYRACDFNRLTQVNVYFIQRIMEYLEIDTEIRFSSEFELAVDRTQRLLDICSEVGADVYYSGPAAKAYMDETKFEAKGVSVKYWDYSGYSEYPQGGQGFEHGVTILDMLFNLGPETKDYLKFAR